MTRLNRRAFLKNTVAGASGAFLATPAFARAVPSHDDRAPKLISRTLGRTGIVLPIVSMGVMRADNPALVKAALKGGIVHLDTANGYQRGKNEEMLGELLKDYPRDSFVISTKIPPKDKEEMMEMVEESLERLRLERVDILYLHGPSKRDIVLDPEYMEIMKGFKTSGKTRFIGVSTHQNEPEVIQAVVDSGIYDVVLTAINFKQDHHADVKAAIASAAKAGVGVVAMKTMAGGYLDKARTKPVNCTAALKWVLQDENVTTAIPGVTTFDMLAENVRVNEDLTMSEKEKADLAYAGTENGLYCQGCERCVKECRKALPIPGMMRAYMYAYGYGSPALGRDLVRELKVASDPCRDCRDCPVVCSKAFDVHERISDISRLHDVPEEFLA
ncbi:MAG: putative oxidoreductase of aldo/keto reductase family [Bacteroidetes bacterium]|jgi:predicted aldo/keto reductase-like oxidoreductase|nr:putative oxidoreductase of aldo/keto reductase family [Bacteroidota bacterium]